MILACFWWKKKGLLLSIPIIVLLVFFPAFFNPKVVIIDNFLRMFIIMVVGLFIVFLSEKISNMINELEYKVKERTKELEYSKELLKLSYNQLNSVFSNLKDIVFVISKNYKILFKNRSANELFETDIEGEECFKTIKGLDRPCENCPMNELTKSDACLVRFEQSIKTPLINEIKVFDIITSQIENYGGQPAIIEVLRDNTERKKAEEELKKAKRFSESIIDSLPGVFYFLDKKGKILRWNNNFEEISEYSAKEILKKDMLDFFWEEDKRNMAEKIQEVFIKGKSSADADFISKSGKKTPHFFTGLRIMIGNIPYLGGMGINITERKKAEEKIRHINAVLKAIRNVNQLIIKEKNREKLIQKACKNLIETRGYLSAWIVLIDKSENFILASEAGIGEKFNFFIDILKKNEFPECRREMMAQSDVFIMENPRLYCRTCSLFKICESAAIMIVRLEHEETFFGWLTVSIPKEMVNSREEQELFNEVANDISFALYNIELEEKRTIVENELKKSEKKSEKRYRMAEFYKDLFAHDTTNILQSIYSGMELIEIILEDPENLDNLKINIKIIKEQVIRATNLISNVRKLSQLEDARKNLKKIEFLSILKNTISLVKKSYKDKNITILVDSSDDEKLFIRANDFLVDVFENLLINAIRHNKNLLIDISIKISRAQKNGTNYLKFEFLDNGIGVSDTRKEIIFKRGFSEEKSVHSMGLGLSLVKGIIETYNGDIWVEDRINGDHSIGSKFILLIPEVD